MAAISAVPTTHCTTGFAAVSGHHTYVDSLLGATASALKVQLLHPQAPIPSHRLAVPKIPPAYLQPTSIGRMQSSGASQEWRPASRYALARGNTQGKVGRLWRLIGDPLY